MAGTRGRRRKRRGGGEKAAEGTDEDSFHHSDNTTSQQDPKDQGLVSSPAFSRYPTRRSRAVFAQCATLRSPLRSPLRNVKRTPNSSGLNPTKRILNDTTHEEPPSANRDNTMPELQHCTSQQPHEDLIFHAPTNIGDLRSVIKDNTVMDIDKSVSAGSPKWSAPVSEHMLDLNNLTTKLTSHCKGPREIQKIAPIFASHQEFENYQPSRENYLVSHSEDRPEKRTTDCADRNSQCLSRSHSINITEFAKRLQDDLDDDPEEEVESAFDPAFDCVNGHRVKVEIAPLLRGIFEKYGDITSESDVKSSKILSFFLERLCDIYEKLERTTFFNVTHIELDDMLEEVRFFERETLNVGWLREKLEYISQTKISFQKYLDIKKEEAKYDVSIGSLEKELEVYRSELSALQRKISAAEENLVANKAKADQIKKVALDIKAKVNTLRKQSLVHGLL